MPLDTAFLADTAAEPVKVSAPLPLATGFLAVADPVPTVELKAQAGRYRLLSPG